METAFHHGAVSVLTATSTLAAGVNLPAQRVIFRHPFQGRKENLLPPSTFGQASARVTKKGMVSHTCLRWLLLVRCARSRTLHGACGSAELAIVCCRPAHGCTCSQWRLQAQM